MNAVATAFQPTHQIERKGNGRRSRSQWVRVEVVKPHDPILGRPAVWVRADNGVPFACLTMHLSPLSERAV